MNGGYLDKKNFYRIHRVELINCPPIGNLQLDLFNGINVVIGGNGTGKSTLVESLRTRVWPHGGSLAIQDCGSRNVFADNWANALVVTDPLSPATIRPACHWTTVGSGHPQILRRVSALLAGFLHNKVGARMTKFQGIPWCGADTFDVEVDPAGSVHVHPGEALRATPYDVSPLYGSIESLFRAMGERCLINVAGVIAVREHLQLDIPLLFDAAFVAFDEFYAASVMDLLRSLNQQVVIFEGESGFCSVQPNCREEDNIVYLPSMSCDKLLRHPMTHDRYNDCIPTGGYRA